MKRKLIASVTLALLLVLVVPVPSAGAAGAWMVNHTIPDWQLWDVHFADADAGWAVGQNGTILSTTDGGENWWSQEVTNQSLWALDFVDTDTGWAAGTGATVFKTTNGGLTWAQQSTNATANLTGIDFVDADAGWAVGGYPYPASGGTILATSDGGVTWSEQLRSPTHNFGDVHFVDDQNGWAVGLAGLVLATSDGGATWTAQSSGTSYYLNDVHFVDAATGWIVGSYGTVLHTTDGGDTWTSQTSGLAGPDANLNAVQFVDGDTGWAVGRTGTLGDEIIISTTDGGTTWTSEGSADRALWGLFFLDADTGWAVGGYEEAPGDIGGIVLHYGGVTEGVAVTADAPAPTELSLTFSVTAGTEPTGGTITDASISFGTLDPNTPKTGSHTLQVTTNAASGYQVTAAEDTPLTFGGYTIPDVTGDTGSITETATGDWDLATTYGFGYTLADVSGTAAAFTTGYKQFADTSAAELPQDVMGATAPVIADAVALTYKLNIGPSQVEGTYANTVTYIATGNL
jgi:photosystem II stability/assembly factor-like uncharacterized protein